MSFETENLTTLDKLTRLRDLLADPGSWSVDGAVNAGGALVSPRDPDACQWDLLAAADKLCFSNDELRLLNVAAWDEFREKDFGFVGAQFGHAGSVRVIRRAIEIEEGRA